MSRRISLIKQDLFLIGKHSDIYLGKLNMQINQSSEFYQQYNTDFDNSCLIYGSKIASSTIKDSYFNKITDKENPLISYIDNYYNTENGDSEKMIKYFKEDNLFNKISFYEGIQDENSFDIINYIGYVCYMKSIFKSIFIKESVSQGKFVSLNSIYLFMNNFIFQYLPNETNINSIKHLSFYSGKDICKNRFNSKCVSDFIKSNFNYSINTNYENNISFVEYFHYFDKKYNFFSCLNLKDIIFNNNNLVNNYLCIEHNINYLLRRQFNIQNLTAKNIKNNITDIISLRYIDGKLLLLYTLKYNIKEFYDVYNYYFTNYNNILKNYVFSKDNDLIELFHLIYFDLFKYKKKELTESKISKLVTEYEDIKKNIINNINELSSYINISNNMSNFEKLIKLQQYFLYARHNTSGILDYENGSIKKDNFAYLIYPILDKNVYYKSNTYTKINFTLIDENYTNKEGNILGYNIILFQNTLHFWDMNLFIIMILISLRWFIYFVILILFISTLFNVLFTKYLDNIFQPISLLYERLSSKIMSNKIVFSEQNEGYVEEKKQKSNIKNVTINNDIKTLNDIDEEITSSTPEMDELIQLCKFLENITYMKKLMLSNEQMDLDFELMNEMYNVLNNKIDMIKYGHFVSSFYFKKKKYKECNISIKVIENILEEEKHRFKEENENIEIEVINVISNKYYINEFQSSREVFESKTSLSQLNYYELIIIREKLYFYLGICNFFEVKDLKNKLKEMRKNYELQAKKNYYNNIRGRSFMPHRRFERGSIYKNNVGNSNNLGEPSFRIGLNTQSKNFKVIENQINKKAEIAMKYFKISYEINTKYCINKIKCIITLLYIAKCQLFVEKTKTEAIDTMKNAIIKLYSLNQDFIKINESRRFNPVIMLLINGAIMEQVLFLIVKINKKVNYKLTIEVLSNIMKISYFKTDNIQSKVTNNIVDIIKKANADNNTKKIIKMKVCMDKIGFFKKISMRLSPIILNNEKQRPNISKNIFIIFSPNLIKILPSYIELSEILSKCIKNYMNKNDKIQCLRFDMRQSIDNMKTPNEFNKEFIIRILLQNDEIINFDKYGMQNCIFSIAHKIYKNRILNNNNIIDGNKESNTNDNYIFQFILSKDYTFNSIENNKKFKEELKNNNISLYTFIFDDDLKEDSSKEDSKMNKIINNLKKIPEGVLILVDNFLNIKMAFQNISRNYRPKNIFRINSSSYDNIYID